MKSVNSLILNNDMWCNKNLKKPIIIRSQYSIRRRDRKIENGKHWLRKHKNETHKRKQITWRTAVAIQIKRKCCGLWSEW